METPVLSLLHRELRSYAIKTLREDCAAAERKLPLMRLPQAENPAKQDSFLISQETAFLSGKPDFLCNKKSKCDMIRKD